MTRISRSRGSSPRRRAQLRQRDVDRARHGLDRELRGVAHVEEEARRRWPSQWVIGMSPRSRFAGDHAREVDRVLRAAERRRVAQLGLLEVVDGRPHLDRHGEGVDPLGHAVLAEHLRAEQAPVGLPEEDLDRHHLGARVVARVRVHVEVELLEVRVPELPRGPSRWRRSGRSRPRRSGRSRCPACRGSATCGRRSRRRRSGPGGWPGPASGMSVHWPVTKSFTSTASPTARMSGSLVRMCSSTRMPPRWPISSPAAFASAVSGRTPIARITTSAGWAFPDAVRTSSEPSAACSNPATPSLSSSLHAVLDQVALDEARHLRVERRHDLVQLLDERHLEPEVGEVLHHLQADEPAADHHRALRLRHDLEPGVRVHPGPALRAALQPLADGPGVRDGPHGEDPGQVDAGKRRADRGGAGRQHQLVVGLGRDRAGGDVAQVHGLRPSARWRRPRSRVRTSTPNTARNICSVATRRLDSSGITPADVVGQPAVRVRDVRPALHHEDLGLLVQPAQPRRTGRPARHSAHDDDLH